MRCELSPGNAQLARGGAGRPGAPQKQSRRCQARPARLCVPPRVERIHPQAQTQANERTCASVDSIAPSIRLSRNRLMVFGAHPSFAASCKRRRAAKISGLRPVAMASSSTSTSSPAMAPEAATAPREQPKASSTASAPFRFNLCGARFPQVGVSSRSIEGFVSLRAMLIVRPHGESGIAVRSAFVFFCLFAGERSRTPRPPTTCQRLECLPRDARAIPHLNEHTHCASWHRPSQSYQAPPHAAQRFRTRSAHSAPPR